jgi:hypothetical protein
MTLTEPLRRITLQLRQIFFTEARTFICYSKQKIAIEIAVSEAFRRYRNL